MAWIRHASGGQTTIKNAQALGDVSPLETDADGYAEVEDADAADLLATLDPHVEVVSGPPNNTATLDQFDTDDVCGYYDPDSMDRPCQRNPGWGRDADAGRCADHHEA